MTAPPGCFPKASAEVYGEPAAFDGEEFTSLFESLGKLATAVDEDPRVVAVGRPMVELRCRRRLSRE